MFYTYVFYSTGAGWMIIYLWLWGPSTRTMWSNMKGSFLVWRRASRDTNPDEPPPEEDEQVRLHDMCWVWFVERQLISSNEHLLKIICNVWLGPVSKLKLYSCGYTRGSQFQSSRPPRSAYFACLSLLTHLIQIISLLEVRSMHELCSDWHAPYSLSREIRWSLLHFGTFIHGFALF